MVAFVITGGELNAEMEHQTRRDSTTGPEMPLGTRGAQMADTVAEGPNDTQTRNTADRDGPPVEPRQSPGWLGAVLLLGVIALVLTDDDKPRVPMRS
jgi:membrane protein